MIGGEAGCGRFSFQKFPGSGVENFPSPYDGH